MKDKVRNRIIDAVMLGICEGFDIDDMDNAIDSNITSKQKVRKHSKMFDDLCNEINDKCIDVYIIDNDAKMMPFAEWDENADNVRFLRIVEDNVFDENCLECFCHDISMSKEWRYYLKWCNWEEACMRLDEEMVNGRTFKGRVPTISECTYIIENLDFINRLLTIVGSDELHFNDGHWWSSSKFMGNTGACFIDGHITYDSYRQVKNTMLIFKMQSKMKHNRK